LVRTKYDIGQDTQDWRIDFARKDLANCNFSEEKITKITYRPFDYRYTYYSGKSGGFHSRPRSDVKSHLTIHRNLALVTPNFSKSTFRESPSPATNNYFGN